MGVPERNREGRDEPKAGERIDENTAATLCRVRGRTIQNRLNRAKAKLSKLKEVS